jgi:hypothetical protein
MIGEIKCMVINQNGTITTNIVTVEDQWFPEQFTTLSTVLVADTAKAILKITANTSLDATINMYFEAKYLGNTSNNLTFL